LWEQHRNASVIVATVVSLAIDRKGEVARVPKRPGAWVHCVERTTLVVIPARDEQADVGEVVASVRALGFPVVVVDDYSGDQTVAVARAAGARVLRLPFHGGSWAAIQTGMRHALEHGYARVVTMDADGQHHAADLPRLLARFTEPKPPNVIIGACPQRANRRRRLACFVLRRLSGLSIDDLTSGFRAYDRAALNVLARQENTLLEYQDVGVLLSLRAHRLQITEVPVTMEPRRHGISRIFCSWPMVGYYLIYSALIGTSRRSRREQSGR